MLLFVCMSLDMPDPLFNTQTKHPQTPRPDADAAAPTAPRGRQSGGDPLAGRGFAGEIRFPSPGWKGGKPSVPLLPDALGWHFGVPLLIRIKRGFCLIPGSHYPKPMGKATRAALVAS